MKMIKINVKVLYNLWFDNILNITVQFPHFSNMKTEACRV